MLNDPAVPGDCIPGCQALEGSIKDRFAAAVHIGIGWVKATFQGSVELRDIVPLGSCRIVDAGKGGAAGFASREAKVELAETGSGTLRSYSVEVRVGGELAQFGARLLKSSVAKATDQFFVGFAAAGSAGCEA